MSRRGLRRAARREFPNSIAPPGRLPPVPEISLPPAAAEPAAHHPAVWRYLRALGARPGEADDLAQETMLLGCRAHLPADPHRAAAFLRGVARNLWLRSRRWWHRRREREIAAEVERLWIATAAADGGDRLIDALRACLAALQPRARQALELHYQDGFGWRDVAARLGMKPNGTKTLVQRARQVLRTCIERSTS